MFNKNLSSDFKIIRSFVKVDQNIYKNANNRTSMHGNQTTMRRNCISKAPRFL